jgi:hypothetical protein
MPEAHAKREERPEPAKQEPERPVLLSARKHASVCKAIVESDRLPVREIEFDTNRVLLDLPAGKACDLRKGMDGVRDREADELVTMQTTVFPHGRPYQGFDPSNLGQFARAAAVALPTGCSSHSRGFPTVKALREAVEERRAT